MSGDRRHKRHTARRSPEPDQEPQQRRTGPQSRPRKLRCGHIRPFPVRPAKGDLVWCADCNDYVAAS